MPISGSHHPAGVRFMTVNSMGWAAGLEDLANVAGENRFAGIPSAPAKGRAIRMGDTGLVSSMSALSSMGNPAITGGS